MTTTSRILLVLLIASAVTIPVSGQVATGTPPFGSFGGGPDIINLANLNSHLTIPVLHKPGRGTNFSYDLTYDSSVWYPVGSSGNQSWQPVSGTWGWQGLAPGGTAYITYAMTYTSSMCYNGGPVPYYEWSFSNFVYVDPFGISHAYNYAPVYFQSPGGSNCPPNGPQPSTPPAPSRLRWVGLHLIRFAQQRICNSLYDRFQWSHDQPSRWFWSPGKSRVLLTYRP
ncbi:MAG TPA: hypothetical protein VNH18_29660 [Bryobacteraceae bacterium]|nr:hypothetical protein [Bryobacteraceae bacterium]